MLMETCVVTCALTHQTGHSQATKCIVNRGKYLRHYPLWLSPPSLCRRFYVLLGSGTVLLTLRRNTKISANSALQAKAVKLTRGRGSDAPTS